MARKNSIIKIENGVVWMDVSTRKWPNKITQFEEADLDLVTAGGRWCVAEKNSGNLYVIRGHPSGKGHEWLHRLILGLEDDDPAVGDHENRDRMDNRRGNLRIATQKQNTWNQSARVGGSSVFRGVAWRANRNCWRARIKVDFKEIHLGHFPDEMSAARAYDEAAVKHYGDFANLNFPESRAA